MAISNENLKDLTKQYKAAMGIKSKIDLSDSSIQNEIISWIVERSKIGKYYINYLDYNDIRFADKDCAEVGKGELDTVVRPFETSIITPYKEKIDGIDDERVYSAKMLVHKGSPYLYRGQKVIKLEPFIFSSFMTQNSDNIDGWVDLHNSGEYRIIIGAYGLTTDKDAEVKIKKLEEYRDKMKAYDAEFCCTTSEGAYYAVIASHPKVKVKTKNLTEF